MTKIDHEHDFTETGCDVVESFIAREGDPDFIPGSWVMAVKCTDEAWEGVLKGEINGFSMAGKANREERIIEVDLPDDGIIKGETMVQDDHTHTFQIELDQEGNFVRGLTNSVNGHFHEITKGTATDSSAGHSHRYSFLEALNESKIEGT